MKFMKSPKYSQSEPPMKRRQVRPTQLFTGRFSLGYSDWCNVLLLFLLLLLFFFSFLLRGEVLLAFITLSRQGIINDLLKKHLPFWYYCLTSIQKTPMLNFLLQKSTSTFNLGEHQIAVCSSIIFLQKLWKQNKTQDIKTYLL